MGGAAEDRVDHSWRGVRRITQNIAKDYEANKYTFHGYLTSGALSGLVCDAAKDMLVDYLR